GRSAGEADAAGTAAAAASAVSTAEDAPIPATPNIGANSTSPIRRDGSTASLELATGPSPAPDRAAPRLPTVHSQAADATAVVAGTAAAAGPVVEGPAAST